MRSAKNDIHIAYYNNSNDRNEIFYECDNRYEDVNKRSNYITIYVQYFIIIMFIKKAIQTKKSLFIIGLKGVNLIFLI